MKLIKLSAVLALSLFFYSCASTPSTESIAPIEDAAQEIPQEPEEEGVAPTEAQVETPEEEIETEELTEEVVSEEDQEEVPEDTMDHTDMEIEEQDDGENTEGGDSDELPFEKTAPSDEPVYEPIEDIQGYYESDPEPVYLQSPDPKKSEEMQVPSDTQETLEDEGKDEAQEIEEQVDSEEKEEPVDSNIEPAQEEAQPISQETHEDEASVDVVDTPDVVEVAKEESVEMPNIAVLQSATVGAADPVQGQTELMPETAAAEQKTADENGVLAEEYEAQDESQIMAESKIVVLPSRSVAMKNNQYLDIVYPGKGWIFLGEEDGKSSMRYFGRKIGEKNTVFSLRSREEGSTILHFYKNDALTGKFIDDYLQVDIKGINRTQEHAVAPSYEEAVPPRPERDSTTSADDSNEHSANGNLNDADDDSSVKTVITQSASAAKHVGETPSSTAAAKSKASGESKKEPLSDNVSRSSKKQKNQQQPLESADDNGSRTLIQNTQSESAPSSPQDRTDVPRTENSAREKSTPAKKAQIQDTKDMTADDILSKAQESFRNKKYQDTLAYLEDFFTKATTRVDEGLFLQGQTFESNSSVRNIKSALDTYETIVRRYPQSVNWAKANERITYLRKFYFNIR